MAQGGPGRLAQGGAAVAGRRPGRLAQGRHPARFARFGRRPAAVRAGGAFLPGWGGDYLYRTCAYLVDGPATGDDRPMLEGYLNWQPVTLLNICAGLTGEQLARRLLPSSNLSLLGLIRHLAKVERIWFRQRAACELVPPMYDPAREGRGLQ